MHEHGVIHGDLKGVCVEPYSRSLARYLTDPKANILINNKGRACLTDFANLNLLTILSDQSSNTSNASKTGTYGTTRWMSPELLEPNWSDLKRSRPTKESDCYALGMVIYEVLSGWAPFAIWTDFVVVREVLGGARPERPRGVQGEWFQDNIWDMLERCWEPQPDDRPGLDAVLLSLKGVVRQQTQDTLEDYLTGSDGRRWIRIRGGLEDYLPDSDEQSDASESCSCMFFFPSRLKFQVHPNRPCGAIRFLVKSIPTPTGTISSTVRDAGGLQVSPPGPLSRTSSLATPLNDDQFLDPPQADNADEGSIGMFFYFYFIFVLCLLR